jgi:ferritin-like metal-binding protein YciE
MLKRLLFVGLFCVSNFTCFGSGPYVLPELTELEAALAAKAVLCDAPAVALRTACLALFGWENLTGKEKTVITLMIKQSEGEVLEALSSSEKRDKLYSIIQTHRKKNAEQQNKCLNHREYKPRKKIGKYLDESNEQLRKTTAQLVMRLVDAVDSPAETEAVSAFQRQMEGLGSAGAPVGGPGQSNETGGAGLSGNAIEDQPLEFGPQWGEDFQQWSSHFE